MKERSPVLFHWHQGLSLGSVSCAVSQLAGWALVHTVPTRHLPDTCRHGTCAKATAVQGGESVCVWVCGCKPRWPNPIYSMSAVYPTWSSPGARPQKSISAHEALSSLLRDVPSCSSFGSSTGYVTVKDGITHFWNGSMANVSDKSSWPVPTVKRTLLVYYLL